jgi:hypothetical protein
MIVWCALVLSEDLRWVRGWWWKGDIWQVEIRDLLDGDLAWHYRKALRQDRVCLLCLNLGYGGHCSEYYS